jgi:alkanesulfonate monooxygenase SsuD/methylene tetrahydromethanopterin reductase-like flavin-dependent oxidoreductase (luciferase family)
MNGLGFGVDAELDPGVAREVAEHCRALGYRSLWSNDTEQASGLRTLRALADAAPGLDVGVGVLPMDRHDPARIAAEVDRLGLDPERLCIGIGAGTGRPPLELIARALEDLRRLLPDAVRVFVAAMRPRMCALAGAQADGAFLNWMPPKEAATAREWVREGASDAGRPPPPVLSYVRVAVGPGAAARLRRVEQVYRGYHPQHFEALGLPLGAVGIAEPDPADVPQHLPAYVAALDVAVVRALADGGDADGLVAVARAAAPATTG